jgi:hypothetical protein
MRLILLGIVINLVCLSPQAPAADLPHPMHVPEDIAGTIRDELVGWRSALLGEMDALGKRIDAQTTKCRAVDAKNTALVAACRAEIRELQGAHDAYYQALANYTERIKRERGKPAPDPPVTPTQQGPPVIAPPPANAQFPPQAAELMAALNTIATWPIYAGGRPLPRGTPDEDRELQSANCQAHFRALGEQLARQGLPSWNHEFPLSQYGKDGSPRANEIFNAIAAESRSGTRWRELTPAEAQAAANRGAIVIGGVPAKPHVRAHGHLAVVIPLPPGLDLAQFQNEKVHGKPATAGTGPFVRDGNEHVFHEDKPDQRYELSTLGAIPASRMMPPAETRYFLWVASEPR